MSRYVGAFFSLLLLASCSNDPLSDSDGSAPYLGPALCSTMVTEAEPNRLFTSPLLPVESILTAYPYGDTQPDDPETINGFELGFYILNEEAHANVSVHAPAALYLRTLQVSRYDTNQDGTVDLEDYSITYVVCSHMVDGKQEDAVAGVFHHLKTLSPDLAAIYEAEKAKVLANDITLDDSAIRCEVDFESAGTCTFAVPHRQFDDPTYELLLAEGDLLGTTSWPGFDSNIVDYRRVNYFINFDRWTSAAGPGAGNRYTACYYEYFAEPYRTQYLSKIGSNGIYRNAVEVDYPCGLFEADLNAEGTAAGHWMVTSKQDLSLESEMSMPEVWNVLEGMLVLKEHYLLPNTYQTIATNLAPVSGSGLVPDAPLLVELRTDTPAGKLTNILFHDVEPGTVYCYQGAGYMNDWKKFNFLLKIEAAPEATLTIERLGDTEACEDMSQAERSAAFTADRIAFVR